MKKIIHRLSERFIEVIFFLWILLRTLLSKTFVHRWETVIFRRSIEKKYSRQLKRPIDVFSSPIRIKDKNLMLNENSHCNNFTRKNSSSKTQIVRRIDFQRQSLVEKSIEKSKTFLFQIKDVFFFFRTFLFERSKDVFILNSMKTYARKIDHSICWNSLQQQIEDETPTVNPHQNKTTVAKWTQNFRILKERKFTEYRSEIRRRNT